nr:hypothetical protein Iba_scaffold10327CG0060 [Ipomoea batatas]GME14244.1 hypothetical protein Iba_scaffold15101CG0030 [Ipomoea batatas]
MHLSPVPTEECGGSPLTAQGDRVAESSRKTAMADRRSFGLNGSAKTNPNLLSPFPVRRSRHGNGPPTLSSDRVVDGNLHDGSWVCSDLRRRNGLDDGRGFRRSATKKKARAALDVDFDRFSFAGRSKINQAFEFEVEIVREISL